MTQGIAQEPEVKPKFSTIRAFFWPIHNYELKKFLPLSLIMFCVLFNYTILRNTKDSILMTSCGAEAIPFVKSYLIMPVAILFVTFYAKLTNMVSKQNLFYICIGIFLVFFGIFGGILYPMRHMIHMTPEKIMYFKGAYPNLQHLIPVLGQWSFALFYLFAELWGTVTLNLLFWQFANEITRTQEARRFYTMLALLGHVGLIVAGTVTKRLCQFCKQTVCVPDGAAGIETYTMVVCMMVILNGLCVMATYRWMNQKVLTDPQLYDRQESVGYKDRPKMSVTESVKHILRSKYLGCIALLVIGYSLTMNLTGLMWKKQLQMAFSNPLDYGEFMGDFSTIIGVITVFIIFCFKGVVEKFGWFKAAMVTPVVLLITASIFFVFAFFGEHLEPWLRETGLTALMVAVYVASAQQLLCKSAKYSMFDPTKEMSYIPLDQELKVKGKAAVDVAGMQFGKASGGYVTSGLLVLTAAGDLMSLAPLMAIVVLLMVGVWIWAVCVLNRLYQGQLLKSEKSN